MTDQKGGTMARLPYQLFAILAATSLLLAACNTINPTPSAAIQAQITQTMQAVATDIQSTLQAAAPTAAPPTNPPLPTATLPPTATPAPTQAPAPTKTPAPVISTPTNLPSVLTAHITANTNCRSGPSALFPSVFTALKGEDLKIVSKTTLGDYVIVENPQSPGQNCWLWTQYVEINGDLSGLQAATPPPTLTPLVAFSLAFDTVVTCNNGWSLEFKVVNAGSKPLQSYKVVAKDKSANTQETTSSNQFDQRSGCNVANEITSVDPGKTGYIYADDFNYNPSGHSMEATITVCSHDNQAGACETQVIKFAP
jgi:hypothetical protein